MSANDEKARRRVARAHWPGIKTTLDEMTPEPDLSSTTTIEERLALVRELTLRSWALTGQPMPDYDREAMPTRIIRSASDDARRAP